MSDPDERPYFPSDDDRDWMRQRMEQTGITALQLAKAAGVTRQAIYFILDGKTRSTTAWTDIVTTLGGKPPGGEPPVADVRLRRLIGKWPTLSEADKQLVEQLTERLGLKKT